MATKWTLADRVANRIKDKPTALGSAVIAEYIEDAAQDVESYTGQSISLTSIGSSMQPVLTNIATLNCLQYMSNVGVSYNLGRTKIDKKTEIEGLKNQITVLENKIQKQMDGIGRKVKVGVLNLRNTRLE